MIVIGILGAVVVVGLLLVRRKRKVAQRPELEAVLVLPPDIPATGVRYRFPGSRGAM